jgi:hypothetical protein
MQICRAACVLFLSATVAAQAQDQGPMSAVDWLSDSVAVPAPFASSSQSPQPLINPDEPPVANSVVTPQISVTPLDSPSPDPIGLLPSEVTGFPAGLWKGSEAETLATLVQAQRVDSLPAMQALLRNLLLAEADAPLGAGPDGRLFLARVDKLLDMGALEPAQALLEAANPDTPALFRRWFDVSLLTGTEGRACTAMRARPDVAPTPAARVFCLARNGDWSAAALTLNTVRALGDIADEEDALLSRFLDPDLYEGEAPFPAPSRPSPLVFRMREAIGEPMTVAGLPRAFAHADLRSTTGWKSQLEAAERLARNGAIAPTRLFGIYMARRPAASGGVWDRVAAVQALDRALETGNAEAVAATLPAAWEAMQAVATEVAFAVHYQPRLSEVSLDADAAGLATEIGLLSPAYEAVAMDATLRSQGDIFLHGVARGDLSDVRAVGPQQAAVFAAFTTATPPAELTAMVQNAKLGEALLRAMAVFNEGAVSSPSDVRDALAFLRSVGLEDIARRLSLEYLLLSRQS